MQYRILIVDDSKLARMVMVSAFRRIRPEWELVEAADADEALKAISSNSVDIALVDFNMPGTDGLELVDRIREIHPTMPVAVVSESNERAVANRSARKRFSASASTPGASAAGSAASASRAPSMSSR